MDLKGVRERALADSPNDKSFWTNNGVVCRNIYELVTTLTSMGDPTFRYHVDRASRRNDFANWIRHVLGDDVLAERLYAINDKDLYADVIKERIKELEGA
jgi:hypothetical protein